MEAVGIAASIISVATAGWNIAQTLYEIADAVKSGGERLRGLSSHIQDTVAIIDEVGNALKEDSGLVSPKAINSAWNYVGRCSEIFAEIEDKINDARGNDLKTFFFPLREPALLRLESELQAKMVNLNLALQCIIAARCKVMNLLSQEILQRMRIQEAVDARNASIKQAAAWEGESEDTAEIDPTTEEDIGSAIALPYPVHQHDRNPNPTDTEQDSELHRERPSKQDHPHCDINKVPPGNSDFNYDSDEKGRTSRTDNIPLQGEIRQTTEYGGHLSPKPPGTPVGAKHDSDERTPLAGRPRTTKSGSRKPKRGLGARVTERHLISGFAGRRGKDPIWSEPSEQLQTVDDLLRFWTTAYEDGDNEHVEKSTE